MQFCNNFVSLSWLVVCVSLNVPCSLLCLGIGFCCSVVFFAHKHKRPERIIARREQHKSMRGVAGCAAVYVRAFFRQAQGMCRVQPAAKR